MKKQISKLLTSFLIIIMSVSFMSINANAATIDESNLIVTKGAEYTLNKVVSPAYGAEWQILALARSNAAVPEDYYNTYYNNVELKVAEEMQKDNPFTYVSNIEKLVIVLNAIGKDPTNVGGYNLVDYIWNMENIESQGINALVYALIALDSKNYTEPINAVNTRESLINKILSLKTVDGGFTYGASNADQDMTGMTLQALAKYYETNNNVKAVINEALALLSSMQRADGGFDNSWGNNPYGAAQIALALTELKLDPTDSKNGFVKENGDIISYLFSLQKADGGFGADANSDSFLTPQVFYSLVGYDRFLNGKNSLYNINDVISETDYEKIVSDINSQISQINNITYDNKDLIRGLIVKYNSLTDVYKAKVVNYNTLKEAKEKIDNLEKTINNLNNDIWDDINPSKITINDKKQVLALIERYEALSEEDKKYIVGYDEVLGAMDKITELENQNKALQTKKEDKLGNEVKTFDSSNYNLYGILLLLSVGTIYLVKKKEA